MIPGDHCIVNVWTSFGTHFQLMSQSSHSDREVRLPRGRELITRNKLSKIDAQLRIDTSSKESTKILSILLRHLTALILAKIESSFAMLKLGLVLA